MKIAIYSAVGIWVAFGAFAAWIWMMEGSAKLAEFGDAFGVINALFSSLAVAGAIYAVILQQQELALTRDEMRQARLAHEQSADAQERMTIIQAHSTILSDLVGDIAAARSRIDHLSELRYEVVDFIKRYPDAIEGNKMPSNLFDSCEQLFRRGHLMGVWIAKQYAFPDVEIPADIKNLLESLADAVRSQRGHLEAMTLTKRDVSETLYKATKSTLP